MDWIRDSEENRNIVLVTVDSVRADHCGFNDTDVDTTPFLDSVAETGVVFTDAVAPGPRTPSSMPEIFTGEPLSIPETNSIDWKTRTTRIGTHISENETIAERLQEAGYSTAAYTANPFTNETMNYDAGFDEFNEIRHTSTESLIDRFSGTRLKPVVYLSQWINKDNWFSQWPTFYDDILKTARRLDQPYFLWVFLLDTHTPYVVPRADRHESSTLGMYSSLLRGNGVFGDRTENSYLRATLDERTEVRIKQAYRDTIRSVDRFMDSLWDDLSEHDPVFVFHSDHGEAFNEHGTYGHQQELYEENIRVPLLLYNTASEAEVDEQVSLRKLGEILVSCATGSELNRSEVTSRCVFSKTETGEKIAARSYPLKCISSEDSTLMYDLNEDPAERHPRTDWSDERAIELHSELESHRDSLSEEWSRADDDYELNAGIRNRLQSLGYKQ